MSIKINDGTGSGKTARVTEDNELLTLSNTRPIVAKAGEASDAFVFPTGFISYTGLSTSLATEHGVLYIQNSAAVPFHIHDFRVSCSEPAYMRIRADGSARTSFASAASQNTNLSGGKTFQGRYEKGQNNAHAGAGVLMSQARVASALDFAFDGAMVLEAGDSITLTAELSATATTRIGATVVGYYHEE